MEELERTRRYWRLALQLIAISGFSGAAQASVVSRLGSIYFYDPLTFDAGILQRGASARGVMSTQGGALVSGIDLPFYRDVSVRAGTVQRIRLGSTDDLDLTWRLRMPILETARFGYLSSIQLNYSGSHAFADVDPLQPAHEVTVAYSAGRTVENVATTRHGQLGVAIRRSEDVVDDLALGTTGIVLRLAHIIQLYAPPRGLGGKWTITFSAAEFTWLHYGVSLERGGDGRLDLTVAAPALHFSNGSATYSLGFSPILTLLYGPRPPEVAWGGAVNLSIFYRHQLE